MVPRSYKAVLILLLAVCSGLAAPALAQPCPAGCDVNKLQPVNQPGATSTDVAAAVHTTLDIMLDAIGSWGGEEVGGFTGSVKSMMDTGYSLWSAWSSVANPQDSIKNSLHNDLVNLQDFLTCKMDNMVTTITTQDERNLIASEMATFNAFVANQVNQLRAGCGAFNCLNVSSLPPSQRNPAAQDNCVVGFPDSSGNCQQVTTWDPLHVVACTYTDPTGNTVHGVCDPAHKDACYSGGLSREGAQAFYNAQLAAFNGGNINGLDGLDRFGPDNMDAVVVAAKMALMQVNYYQQLIMLGSAKGENDTMKAFAGIAANKIKVRYDYLTNITRIRDLVEQYSTFTGTVTDAQAKNPAYGNLISGLSAPDANGIQTASCAPNGGVYSLSEPCYVFNVYYAKYQLAYGCQDAQKSPVVQQTEDFCYWQQNHRDGIQAPCSHDTLPYGLANIAAGNYIDVCTGSGDSPLTCRIDSNFPVQWAAKHDAEFRPQFTAAKEAFVQEVYNNMTTALKDVAGIIDKLTNLSTVGMPANASNAFLYFYPAQACDQAPPRATAATSRSPLLKGDGAMPLPAGAVVVVPPAPTAPVVASPPPLAVTSMEGGISPPPAGPVATTMPPAPASPMAAPMPPMASPAMDGAMSQPPASQVVGTMPPAPASPMAAPMPPAPSTSVEAPKAGSGNRKMLL